MKNKKLSMLLLLFGMVSMPCDEVKAEMDTDSIAREFNGNDNCFQELLHNRQGSDVNFDYLAYITSCLDFNIVEALINEAINCADKDNSELVMMKHIFMANNILWPNEKLVDIEEEFEEDLMKYPVHIRAVALHEAGHAVATLCSGANNFLYLSKINLFSDISRDGFIGGINHLIPLFCDEADLTEEELQYFAKVDLGGYVSERVFQQFACEDQQLDGDDAECLEAHINQILKMRFDGSASVQKQEEITIECFNQTCQLIILHKDKVERLALALLKKKILYADEIYELCGVDKPKLEIRK